MKRAGFEYSDAQPFPTGSRHFSFGKNVVAVSHGITKEKEVPPEEIELAIKRRNLVMESPDKYTADFEEI